MTYLEKMENLVEEGKEMKIMEIILETISFWQVKKKNKGGRKHGDEEGRNRIIKSHS